jgi:hypothetical protein
LVVSGLVGVYDGTVRAKGHLNRIQQVSNLMPTIEALFPRGKNLVPLDHSWFDFV